VRRPLEHIGQNTDSRLGIHGAPRILDLCKRAFVCADRARGKRQQYDSAQRYGNHHSGDVLAVFAPPRGYREVGRLLSGQPGCRFITNSNSPDS